VTDLDPHSSAAQQIGRAADQMRRDDEQATRSRDQWAETRRPGQRPGRDTHDHGRLLVRRDALGCPPGDHPCLPAPRRACRGNGNPDRRGCSPVNCRVWRLSDRTTPATDTVARAATLEVFTHDRSRPVRAGQLDMTARSQRTRRTWSHLERDGRGLPVAYINVRGGLGSTMVDPIRPHRW